MIVTVPGISIEAMTRVNNSFLRGKFDPRQSVGGHRRRQEDSEHRGDGYRQRIDEISAEGKDGEGRGIVVAPPDLGQEGRRILVYLDIAHEGGTEHPEEGEDAGEAHQRHDGGRG